MAWPFGKSRATEQGRRAVQAYITDASSEPDDADVEWLTAAIGDGDVDRARWELRYALRHQHCEGAARIAASIYREIRNSHDWGRQFPESLSEAALDKLASLPPREMRRAIHSAFGTAKVAGRTEVSPDDIQDARLRKQRIGF